MQYTEKNKMTKSTIRKKCRNIELLLTDVDGVLTDGAMYYSNKGEIMKKFNTKDGMGVELLNKIGIKTIFITRENSQIVKQRAKKLNVDSYINIKNKMLIVTKIAKKFDINLNKIAYIGDDVNDYTVMKQIGFTATPNNAIQEIKDISDYICEKNGGDGAFREIADLIIEIKK